MSKAVGGASAVGCGVFGLGGVIITVGLIAWLSSMALPGSGGDDVTTTGATTTVPEVPADAAIALDPAGPFDDGARVQVDGTGFGSAPIVVTQCLTHPPEGADDPCDPVTSVGTVVDAGRWRLEVVVSRTITVGGTAYDCAASSGACQLLAHPNGSATGPAAPLEFAAGLGPVDAIAPPTG